MVEDLAALRFINGYWPILFLGQPGCGKIHLAVALATLAVDAGYRGYFTTADNLCRTPVRSSIEGNLSSKMTSFTAPTVLVIDDGGRLPLGGTEASAVFFQVVNSRYEKGHPTARQMFGRSSERGLVLHEQLPNPNRRPHAYPRSESSVP